MSGLDNVSRALFYRTSMPQRRKTVKRVLPSSEDYHSMPCRAESISRSMMGAFAHLGPCATGRDSVIDHTRFLSGTSQ